MIMNKTSAIVEFILLGLESDPRWVLDFTLLTTYLIILTGNILVISLVCSDVILQSPMYFFICNLSLIEISFTTSVIPKMLHNSLSHVNTISKLSCLSQSFFYFLFGTIEMVLLAVMSFDRYVAICHPLRYTSIVTHNICLKLCLGCWLGSFIFLLFPITLISYLPFCGPNIINHFFCDSTLLIKLSCTDVGSIELWNSTAFNIVILGSLLFNTVSYIFIISAILTIPSGKRCFRTFSTCASHLLVVILYYGSSIFMYILASPTSSLKAKKSIALMTIVVTPTMTPFIYCLRNQNVKEAFKKCLTKLRNYMNATLHNNFPE